VRLRPFHPKIHFIPGRIEEFALAHHRHQEKAHPEPDRGKGGDVLELLQRHRGAGQPPLSEFAEALRLLDPPLRTLLLVGG
jgi:hypothetical protein